MDQDRWSHPTPRVRRPPFNDPRGIGTATAAALIASALTSGGSPILSSADLHPLVGTASLPLAWAAAWGISGTLWLIWQHRCYSNLPALGITPQRKTAWATLAWIVPFASLVVPPSVIGELVAVPYGSRTTSPGTSLRSTWWTAAITGSIVIRLSTPLGLAVLAVAAFLGAGVVRQVTNLQRSLHAEQSETRADRPSPYPVIATESKGLHLGAVAGIALAIVVGLGALGAMIVAVFEEVSPPTIDAASLVPSSGDAPTDPDVPSGLAIADVELGECFDFVDETEGLVTRTSCSQEHDAQLLHRFDVAATSTPSLDALFDYATFPCLEGIQKATDMSVSEFEAHLWFFVPTKVTWLQGDRTVDCIVYTEDSPLRGDLRSPNDRVAWAEATEGECYVVGYDDITLVPSDCETGDFLVRRVHRLGEHVDAGFPGDDHFTSIFAGSCEDPTMEVLPPTEESWYLGDRVALCLEYREPIVDT